MKKRGGFSGLLFSMALGAFISAAAQTAPSPVPAGTPTSAGAPPTPAGGIPGTAGSQTPANPQGPQPLPPTSSQPSIPGSQGSQTPANPQGPQPLQPTTSAPTVPVPTAAPPTAASPVVPASKPAAPAPSPLPPTGSPPPQSQLPPGVASLGVTSTVLPAGTKVLLALRSGVNTKTARVGDGVYLVSTFPITDGMRVVLPAGIYVQGSIDRVVRPGRIKGRAEVGMHFTSMIFPNGAVVSVPGSVDGLPGSGGPKIKDGEGTIQQEGTKGRDIGRIAQDAATGAEIGTIAGAATGHLGSGLGIGSGAGALVGVLTTLFTRGDDVVIESGTSIEMVLQHPLELQQSQLAGLDTAHNDQSWVPVPPPTNQLPKPKRGRPLFCPDGLGCAPMTP